MKQNIDRERWPPFHSFMHKSMGISWGHISIIHSFAGLSTCLGSSVTRLGDLLDFGQLFQNLWQQIFCPKLTHS